MAKEEAAPQPASHARNLRFQLAGLLCCQWHPDWIRIVPISFSLFISCLCPCCEGETNGRVWKSLCRQLTKC
jgi:hypothetical protein